MENSHFAKGEAFLESMDYDKAIIEFSTYLETYPDNKDAIKRIGYCYLEQKKYEKAIEVFSQAVDKFPDDRDCWLYLGDAYVHSDRHRDACTVFQKAADIQEDLDVLLNLANSLKFTENTDECFEVFNRACQHYDDSAILHFNFGLACQELNNISTAIIHYQKAIQLDPDMMEAKTNLGVAYMTAEQYDLAIDHYRTLIKENPGIGDARFNLGTALAKKGLYKRALEAFRESEILLRNAYGPNDPKVAECQANIQLAQRFLNENHKSCCIIS